MFDMQYLSLLLVALGLSADCFAVAISTSITNRNLRFFHFSRISLTFGTFHTVMPALGWLAGYTVVKFVGGFDHWLAFVLLGFIGGKMVWSAFRKSEKNNRGTDVTNITRFLPLIIIGVATSIDALAVGLSSDAKLYNRWRSCCGCCVSRFLCWQESWRQSGQEGRNCRWTDFDGHRHKSSCRTYAIGHSHEMDLELRRSLTIST
jgi:putative Mn2+ efflux pump MntP